MTTENSDAESRSEKPAHQRPELPDFWDHRFRNNFTPWEAGKAPQSLRDFVSRYENTHNRTHDRINSSRRILVPGCGSAWDAAFLDASDWEVSALDFSHAAVEAARSTLGDTWRGTLLHADFFDFVPQQPFDVIYERAFLCALPRPLWPDYAPRMAELLRPNGLLCGFYFLDDTPKGPPFGILAEQLHAMLDPYFTQVSDQPVSDSLPVFAGRERWQEWRRR